MKHFVCSLGKGPSHLHRPPTMNFKGKPTELRKKDQAQSKMSLKRLSPLKKISLIKFFPFRGDRTMHNSLICGSDQQLQEKEKKTEKLPNPIITISYNDSNSDTFHPCPSVFEKTYMHSSNSSVLESHIKHDILPISKPVPLPVVNKVNPTAGIDLTEFSHKKTSQATKFVNPYPRSLPGSISYTRNTENPEVLSVVGTEHLNDEISAVVFVDNILQKAEADPKFHSIDGSSSLSSSSNSPVAYQTANRRHSLEPITSMHSHKFKVPTIKDDAGYEIGEIFVPKEKISGISPRKPAPSGRSRRLTIQQGNHPCAEDRQRRFPFPEDTQNTVIGSYSGVRPGTGNDMGGSNRYHRDSRKGSYPGDCMEHTGVSFLSVPQSPLRRPSTADVMIEKFHVERNEGGGLSISGVALSAHCHLTLIICGAFCLLAGIVLTYVAFVNANPSAMTTAAPPSSLVQTTAMVPTSVGPVDATKTGSVAGSFAGNATENSGNSSSEGFLEAGADSGPTATPLKSPAANQNHNLTIVGPVCIATGMLMIIVGLSLLALGRKIHRDEKESRRFESEAQLNQLQRSFSVPRGTPLTTNIPIGADQSYPILSLRRGSFWIDNSSRDVCSPTTPPYFVASGLSSPNPRSESPTPSTQQSILSSRASSPITGCRVSVAHSTYPSWSMQERMDVGSFPNDVMEPPSKVKRVAHSPDQARMVSDQQSCSPEVFQQPNTFQTLEDHTPDILNLEDDAGPTIHPEVVEGVHSGPEGTEEQQDNVDLNALLGRPPDYESVQEEIRRERSSRMEMPFSRSDQFPTQTFRRLSVSSTPSMDCNEHNLPYPVPRIHITPSVGPTPPPLHLLPPLPRLSRHSTDSRASSPSRPATATDWQE